MGAIRACVAAQITQPWNTRQYQESLRSGLHAEGSQCVADTWHRFLAATGSRFMDGSPPTELQSAPRQAVSVPGMTACGPCGVNRKASPRRRTRSLRRFPAAKTKRARKAEAQALSRRAAHVAPPAAAKTPRTALAYTITSGPFSLANQRVRPILPSRVFDERANDARP